jgi:hypothetical protein
MNDEYGYREVADTERVFRSISEMGSGDYGSWATPSRSKLDVLMDLMAQRATDEFKGRLEAVSHGLDLEEQNQRLRSLVQEWELAALRAGEGAARIAHERARQQIEEGYGQTHDDDHEGGELAYAAAAYAIRDGNLYPPSWSPDHWKPEDDIRNLEKAGALIAAEIDRLLRVRDNPGQTKPDTRDLSQPDFDSKKNIVNIEAQPFA